MLLVAASPDQLPARCSHTTTWALRFSDDGDRGLGDRRARDGLYSTLFTATNKPGVYAFKVIVESDGRSVAYAERGERLLEDERYDHGPIPAFRREFTLSLNVGKEPFPGVEVEPNHGYPGQELEVRLMGRNTHFAQDHTAVDFGEGIELGSVEVLDKETIVVRLYIKDDAKPGPRDVKVVTPIYKETVELEGGFYVLSEEED
jgi:hypothetical protein